MFGQLFIKECRQTARSLIYWVVVLILVFNFTSQLGDMEIEKTGAGTGGIRHQTKP